MKVNGRTLGSSDDLTVLAKDGNIRAQRHHDAGADADSCRRQMRSFRPKIARRARAQAQAMEPSGKQRQAGARNFSWTGLFNQPELEMQCGV